MSDVPPRPVLRTVRAGVLDVAYEESGHASHPAVLLMHGFPYDVRAYDDVVAILAPRCRTIVPYLRGYGPTRFIDAVTPRSGEQAALGSDALALMDALGIERAVLAGYDWGGRAACVAAALSPSRALGLVTCGGYDIQEISKAMRPSSPDSEARKWYQYYFHSERGRAGLTEEREALCRYLWSTWSPDWRFDDETFARTASSFANPDFVDVVIHSYRRRYGLVAGDPAYAAMQHDLERQPPIDVPSIDLRGESDGVDVVSGAPEPEKRARFRAAYDRRVLSGIGHNVPQEAPGAFAVAVLDLLRP